jgi:hypothetical protein
MRSIAPLLALVLHCQDCVATPVSFVKRLAALPREQPLLFGASVTCVKTAAADVLTQTAGLGRGWSELDWRRIGVFALFGALYLGGVQYALFVKIYPRLLPLASTYAAMNWRAKLADGRGFASVLAQVALDQGLHWPFAAIPCFYLFKGLGEGESIGATGRALRQNWSSDVLACWAFWLPADAVSFGVLPLHWQVPFAAAVSFAYTSFVSFRRGERLASE